MKGTVEKWMTGSPSSAGQLCTFSEIGTPVKPERNLQRLILELNVSDVRMEMALDATFIWESNAAPRKC
jgi:hypothetical protein